MSLSPSQSRTVTELDHVRISNLLRRQPAPGGAASAIEVLLDNADLVPSQDVAPDVVTMYTRVLPPRCGRGHRFCVGAVPGRCRPARGVSRLHHPLDYPRWAFGKCGSAGNPVPA